MRPQGRRAFLKSAASATIGSVLATTIGPTASATNTLPARKIKIGQLGTGHAHAAGKMAALRKLTADFEVVGICEPDAARRTASQSQPAYRGLTWLTEEQLLNIPGLEAVAVETTVPDLISAASRSVRAGKHLHLDKPAGVSLAAFRELLDEATAKDLSVQMGYMFRNNPGFQLAFRAVRQGWLGNVFEIHAVMSKFVATPQRAAWLNMPGGTMFELGCHLIDATVAVMGRPDRVTPFIRQTRRALDSVADNMLAVLEYPQATCTIRSAIVEFDGFQRRQFVICGDRGTADIRPLEPPRMQLTMDEAREEFQSGSQTVDLPKMPGRYDDQLAELAQLIRGEIENPYPPAHDMAVHETILKASGMPVDQ